MLPKINGFEILKQIRKEKIEAKVIMLTAKSMLDDKLTGINSGANDYITKPFHVEELVARVNAQLRMNQNQTKKDYIEAGDIRLNTKTNEEIETVNPGVKNQKVKMKLPIKVENGWILRRKK